MSKQDLTLWLLALVIISGAARSVAISWSSDQIKAQLDRIETKLDR